MIQLLQEGTHGGELGVVLKDDVMHGAPGHDLRQKVKDLRRDERTMPIDEPVVAPVSPGQMDLHHMVQWYLLDKCLRVKMMIGGIDDHIGEIQKNSTPCLFDEPTKELGLCQWRREGSPAYTSRFLRPVASPDMLECARPDQ